MKMWQAITAGLTLIGAIVGYILTGKKNAADVEKAAGEFADARATKNESADDREDIEEQKERMDKIKEEELKNAVAQAEPKVVPPPEEPVVVHAVDGAPVHPVDAHVVPVVKQD